jgi:hypothetical protein
MVFMVGKGASFALAQDTTPAAPPTEVVASPTIPLSHRNFLKSTMKPFLYPTETLTSENGRFELALHVDGNLVLKDKGNPVWDSNTADSYDILYLQLQEDGNLVMYGQNLRIIWSSDTSAEKWASEYILLLQNDGNLVIFTINGERVWALK